MQGTTHWLVLYRDAAGREQSTAYYSEAARSRFVQRARSGANPRTTVLKTWER